MRARTVDPKLVFDIGMNICEDTDYYLRKSFRVIALEANPTMCREASVRYSNEIEQGRLVILNNALATETGRLAFFVCKEMSAWSTTVPQLRDFWAARGATFDTIEVEAITPQDLLSRFGVPYYIKIDIEGQDTNFLRGLVALEAAPTHLSFEVDFKDVSEAIQLCRRLGCLSFSLVNQKEVTRQKPPLPAREGCNLEYEFHKGSSGLFGRELPAKWVSARSIRSTCRKIIWQTRFAKLLRQMLHIVGQAELAERIQRKERFLPTQTWYDIHASRTPHDKDGQLVITG